MTGILEQLQSQRTLLLDVVRQLETAIVSFGGSLPAANGNGVGARNNHKNEWWTKLSAAQRAKVIRKRNRTRRANRRADAAVPETVSTV